MDNKHLRITLSDTSPFVKGQRDPITRQPFKPGEKIILCQAYNGPIKLESWDPKVAEACPYCGRKITSFVLVRQPVRGTTPLIKSSRENSKSSVGIIVAVVIIPFLLLFVLFSSPSDPNSPSTPIVPAETSIPVSIPLPTTEKIIPASNANYSSINNILERHDFLQGCNFAYSGLGSTSADWSGLEKSFRVDYSRTEQGSWSCPQHIGAFIYLFESVEAAERQYIDRYNNELNFGDMYLGSCGGMKSENYLLRGEKYKVYFQYRNILVFLKVDDDSNMFICSSADMLENEIMKLPLANP